MTDPSVADVMAAIKAQIERPSIDGTAERVRSLLNDIARGGCTGSALGQLRVQTEKLNRLLAGRHAGVSNG